jgi:hypothetical protein
MFFPCFIIDLSNESPIAGGTKFVADVAIVAGVADVAIVIDKKRMWKIPSYC